MYLSEFWARFKSFVPLNQTRALSGIQSPERFRAIIRRERVRADRNQHQFSLVVFDVGNPETNNAQVRHLAHVLANRIRLADEAGWFDGHRIGIVLPETSAVGAWRLADDVCQTIAAKSLPPECTVYTYPSRWFSDTNGHSAQLHFADLSPEWRTKTAGSFSISTKHADSLNTDFATQECPANTRPNCRAVAQGLEPFFVRPLPAWKGVMDIVGALLALVVLSPLLLLVALIIKTVSQGPVLFKQQRAGYAERTFGMLKFRTMRVNVDSSVHQQHVAKLINGSGRNDVSSQMPMTKLDNDPQIIPFGKILRKTCLDELPQLINVLRGEMSLVGPRPPIPYEVENYLQWHYGRFDAIPGMTGLWQVSGKNWLTFDQMVRLDLHYWRKKSLWLDIKILLKTPSAIVSQIKDSFSLQKKQLLIKDVVENA